MTAGVGYFVVFALDTLSFVMDYTPFPLSGVGRMVVTRVRFTSPKVGVNFSMSGRIP